MKTINTKIMYVTIGRNGMKRMTERDEHGDIYVKEHDYIQAGKRLAEYEDTDLTPEEIIQLDKQNEEIQNSNIEYYNRAKDAEDRCKKIEQQNKRLKELLKLAFEEIYKISELNKDVCFMECDSFDECSFVCDETGICKWKYADEVEEVLKEEEENE